MMVCTVCFQDDPVDPPNVGENLPVAVVIELCKSWRCRSCLDDLDAQLAEDPDALVRP